MKTNFEYWLKKAFENFEKKFKMLRSFRFIGLMERQTDNV